MLNTMQLLQEYTLLASDGEVGRVHDGLFDDHTWVIRYLVVETGSWLASREVLVSPYALGTPDAQHKTLAVRSTLAQVRDSPGIDTRPSVSRQHEMEYAKYYGYPYYWGGSGMWGDGALLPAGDAGVAARHRAQGPEPAQQHRGNGLPHPRP